MTLLQVFNFLLTQLLFRKHLKHSPVKLQQLIGILTTCNFTENRFEMMELKYFVFTIKPTNQNLFMSILHSK